MFRRRSEIDKFLAAAEAGRVVAAASQLAGGATVERWPAGHGSIVSVTSGQDRKRRLWKNFAAVCASALASNSYRSSGLAWPVSR